MRFSDRSPQDVGVPDGTSLVAGWDPGVQGAYALLDRSGALVSAQRLPIDEDGFLDRASLLERLQPFQEAVCGVMVEKACASPGDGAQAAFTYGRSYEAAHWCATFLGWTVRTVTPNQWQKDLLRGIPRVDGKVKNAARLKAEELWGHNNPRLRSTHEVDAALLAEYGRRALWPD